MLEENAPEEEEFKQIQGTVLWESGWKEHVMMDSGFGLVANQILPTLILQLSFSR